MRFTAWVFLAGLASTALLAGVSCRQATPTPKGGLRVALATDSGGINDQSFNQSAWEGLQKVQKKLDLQISYKEGTKIEDYLPNIEGLLDRGADIIIANGSTYAQTVEEEAKRHPNRKFVFVGYALPQKGLSNLVSLDFKEANASFLAGYLAMKSSKTHRVGFIGGMEGTVLHSYQSGYQAGALYALVSLGIPVESLNEALKNHILSGWIGSYTDAAKGKSMAFNMYRQGVDVIFSVAAGAGDGVIEAAKSENKWVIGVDRNQSYLAPKNVLTSVEKNVGAVLGEFLEGYQQTPDAYFKGQQSLVYGLKGGAMKLSSSAFITSDEQKELIALKAKILSKDITVPENRGELESFSRTLS